LKKISSPSERLRSFEKRNTLHTTTRVMAADRDHSVENRGKGNMALAEKSIRQHVKAHSVKAQHIEVLDEEDDPFEDVTRKHHNEDGAALFQSWRKSPKREHSSKSRTKHKKKNTALFQHSQQEYEERDRRRLQTIVHTVRSMEAPNYQTEATPNGLPSRGDSWDTQHLVSGEKLNAALDAVEQCRTVSKEDNEKPVHGKSMVDPKPIVKSVTNWGIDAIVSDLSSSSMGLEHAAVATKPMAAATPPKDSTPNQTMSVTQKIQQALADAKNQIYPERFDPPSENSCLRPINQSPALKEPTSISSPGDQGDKYLMQLDDTTDEFDKEARQRLKEARTSNRFLSRAPPESKKNNMQQTFLTSDRVAASIRARQSETPKHSNQDHVTPKHSNTHRAKTQQPETTPQSRPRARSKSPDAMFPAGKTSKQRSRSKTPEGLRLGSQAMGHRNRIGTPDRVRSLLDSAPPSPAFLNKKKSILPFQGVAEAPGQMVKSLKATLSFGRSRSVTPTRDLRPHDTPSASSSIFTRSHGSQSRALTPNRLLSSRRRSMPGLIMMDRSLEYTDRIAEEKLMQIHRQRAIQNSVDGEYGDSYQRPKVTPKRDFVGSVEGGRQSVGSGSYNTREGAYGAPARSPRDSTPSRWFGRRREEVPMRSATQDVVNSSLSSMKSLQGSRGMAAGGRFSTMRGGADTTSRHKPWGSSNGDGHSDGSKDSSLLSDRMMKHMMTFDSLMRAIEKDKKNTLGAEFAVVELGDEENAVQTHAILMNRDDVEGQLSSLNSKEKNYLR
jgi:hypothetical protein